MRNYRAIGLMSGTSHRTASMSPLIETDGEIVSGFGPTALHRLSERTRRLCCAQLADAATGLTRPRHARLGVLAEAEQMMTALHAEAPCRLSSRPTASTRPTSMCVGFHGQTMLHRPEQRLTVQIGDGQALADGPALPVVYDLRAGGCRGRRAGRAAGAGLSSRSREAH